MRFTTAVAILVILSFAGCSDSGTNPILARNAEYLAGTWRVDFGDSSHGPLRSDTVETRIEAGFIHYRGRKLRLESDESNGGMLWWASDSLSPRVWSRVYGFCVSKDEWYADIDLQGPDSQLPVYQRAYRIK